MRPITLLSKNKTGSVVMGEISDWHYDLNILRIQLLYSNANSEISEVPTDSE